MNSLQSYARSDYELRRQMAPAVLSNVRARQLFNGCRATSSETQLVLCPKWCVQAAPARWRRWWRVPEVEFNIRSSKNIHAATASRTAEAASWQTDTTRRVAVQVTSSRACRDRPQSVGSSVTSRSGVWLATGSGHAADWLRFVRSCRSLARRCASESAAASKRKKRECTFAESDPRTKTLHRRYALLYPPSLLNDRPTDRPAACRKPVPAYRHGRGPPRAPKRML